MLVSVFLIMSTVSAITLTLQEGQTLRDVVDKLEQTIARTSESSQVLIEQKIREYVDLAHQIVKISGVSPDERIDEFAYIKDKTTRFVNRQLRIIVDQERKDFMQEFTEKHARRKEILHQALQDIEMSSNKLDSVTQGRWKRMSSWFWRNRGKIATSSMVMLLAAFFMTMKGKKEDSRKHAYGAMGREEYLRQVDFIRDWQKKEKLKSLPKLLHQKLLNVKVYLASDYVKDILSNPETFKHINPVALDTIKENIKLIDRFHAMKETEKNTYKALDDKDKLMFFHLDSKNRDEFIKVRKKDRQAWFISRRT